MRKAIVSIVLAAVVFAACFIKVDQQKTVLIKSSFFNIFKELATPKNWQKWRPDLHTVYATDSSKITIKKTPGVFNITSPPVQVSVKIADAQFNITDSSSNKGNSYSYLAVPAKLPTETFVTVYKSIPLYSFLAGLVSPPSLADTHIADLKNYMETDSLFYGIHIVKTTVPGDKLIVVIETVLSKDKLIAANKALTSLQDYLKLKNLKQVQPIIAQFLPVANDSTQFKVGIFVDKEVPSSAPINFERMPKGATLITTKYHGRFNERDKAYNAMHQYYSDHTLQSGILPFEFYLDNKLPLTDTDKVNIRINFSTLN